MRILLISVVVAALCGCAADSPTKGALQLPRTVDCQGKKGNDIMISYGDSRIDVTPKVKAKQDERLVITLQPGNKSDLNVDYGKLVIHIIGKGNKSNWLNLSVAADQSTNKKFDICIGDVPEDTYQYQVIVPGVGIIDPRVEIKNDN